MQTKPMLWKFYNVLVNSTYCYVFGRLKQSEIDNYLISDKNRNKSFI